MVGKIVGQMYFCTICPKEYKTNNGLKKHYVTEHTVVGAKYHNQPLVVQSSVDNGSVTLDATMLANDARQEMINIQTHVVETVTTDMEDIFSQNDGEVGVVGDKEVESTEGQTDTISQMCQNMRDMVEIVENPSQMFGSCDKCDYISLNDKELKEHVGVKHPEIVIISDKDEIIKKMGKMLRKASQEKKSCKKQIFDLKKELLFTQMENSKKTKRISILMVENSTKDDLSNVETTEKDNNNTSENIPEKEIEFDCALCEYKASTKREIDGHIRFEHLKCQTCKEHFRTVDEFKSHMTVTHKNSIWHKKKEL